MPKPARSISVLVLSLLVFHFATGTLARNRSCDCSSRGHEVGISCDCPGCLAQRASLPCCSLQDIATSAKGKDALLSLKPLRCTQSNHRQCSRCHPPHRTHLLARRRRRTHPLPACLLSSLTSSVCLTTHPCHLCHPPSHPPATRPLPFHKGPPPCVVPHSNLTSTRPPS